MHGAALPGFGLLGMLLLGTLLPAPGTAGGGYGYQGKRVELHYAWLVTGPDAMDESVTVRHLILSATDIGATIEACTTLSCTDSGLMEGMTVDLNGGPRINYWVVHSGQRVQYSGTQEPQALELTGGDPARLAGSLAFDDAPAGGPTVDVRFDAPLVKELHASH